MTQVIKRKCEPEKCEPENTRKKRKYEHHVSPVTFISPFISI